MVADNLRPNNPGGEPPRDAVDWKTKLQPDSRQRIVNKMMETLRRQLPLSGQQGLQELNNIAARIEEMVYTDAISQRDYECKISLKMLSLENKSQNTMPNALPANSAGCSNRLPDAGASHSLQPQVQNMVQSHPIPLSGNQFQAHQQLLSQNIQNSMASSEVQSSAGLASVIPPVSGIPLTPMACVVGKNNGMQNIPSTSQASAGNQMGQAVPSNVFSNSLQQMEGRKQDVLQPQVPESQNSQQQLLKPKFQQGNLSRPLRPSHIQQQLQQQNLFQPNQLQSCQQQQGVQTSSVMQPSMIQSTSISGLPQNQPSSLQQPTSSMLQQRQQSVPRKQLLPQQQAQMMKHPLLASKQQSNTANMQQSQSISQQNSMGDVQRQQRQHSQQNNLQNLQQQELLAQQNNLSTMQQFGPQTNVVLQQQQQLLGSQSGNPGMPVNQHSIQMLQQAKVPMLQHSQQGGTNLLVTQGQQSQSQPSPQQLMSQMQSPPTQLKQQLSLQQQQPPAQCDLQQRLQASGQATSSLLQSQSVIDQQKQLFQSQRTLPDTSSTSLDAAAQTGQANGGDWQEEVYQKIKQMKDAYLPEMTEMYHKVAAKVQQQDSLPQQPKSDQLDKLKFFKGMVERTIQLLQIPKSSITPAFKENLGAYEKRILSIVSKNRLGKQVSSMWQGLPQPHMQSLHQSQSQVSQVQPHENHVNSQLQSMDLQGSAPTMSPNSMSNLQHNSLTSISGDMMNALQPGSSMDSGQGGSLQLVAVGSLQQNPVSTFQQSSISYLSTSSGMNMPQPNIRIQSNSNKLQHQNLKQQQEQQMLRSQHLKQQIQQCQMQQLMQKQQQQQLPAQMQMQQILQLHQMNDANEIEIQHGMGVKPGVFQQHLPTDQHSLHPHQQMESGTSIPISSPQLLQAASPQLLQQSSPWLDQQNILSSLIKTGTPLQSVNSPFVVPSPQTPLASSPMLGYSEKPISGTSSLSNVGHQQTLAAPAPASASPLAIGTPGILALPLLAEFTGLDGACGGTLTTASGKSNVMEQPLEHLLKVKPVSSKALSSSASDIGSVVSMVDRTAGSNPVNGSRAAVGEDLVAMTKCCLQARNCVTQDGMDGTRKMKRYTNAMPLNVVSSVGSINDSFKQSAVSETSDLELNATSGVKRRKIEANHVLMEEIREINQQLIDTVVDISQEDVDPTVAAAAAEGGEGTVVKCSFSAVALSPNLKLQCASAQLSPIQPLRLLVPVNYPNRSPILIDKLPVEVSKEYEDLSAMAKSRFSISLRNLSQPASLWDIAKTWDACARAIISEYAQESGGGSFSSKYGTWENCLSAV